MTRILGRGPEKRPSPFAPDPAAAFDAFATTGGLAASSTAPPRVDPLATFDVNFDLNRLIDENSAFSPGLSPTEARREEERKRKGLLAANWDLQVRGNLNEAMKAHSFGGFAPTFDPNQRFDGIRGETGMEVSFEPQFGGYLGTLIGRDGRTQVAQAPRAWLSEIDEAPALFGNRLRWLDEIRSGRVPPQGLRGVVAGNFPDPRLTPAQAERHRALGIEAASTVLVGPLAPPSEALGAEGTGDLFPEVQRIPPTLRFILEVAPIIGNVLAGFNSVEHFNRALRALRAGDTNAFLENGGLGLIDAIGVVPGFGAPARAATRYLLKAADLLPPVRKLRSHRTLARHKKASEDFHPRTSAQPTKLNAEDALGDVWQRATPQQRGLLNGLFPNIKGTAGERQIIDDIRRGGHVATEQGPAKLTRATIMVDGKAVIRNYDALVQVNEKSFYNNLTKVFKGSKKSSAVEVKTDRSYLPSQARTDRHFGDGNSLADEVVIFRIPHDEIKPRHLLDTATQMLAKHRGKGPNKLSDAQVEAILGRLGKLYRERINPLPMNLAIGATARVIAHELATASEK